MSQKGLGTDYCKGGHWGLGVPEVALQVAEFKFLAVTPKIESISPLDIDLMGM